MVRLTLRPGGAIKAGLLRSAVGPWRSWGARLDGIEEVRGSNPLGSTIFNHRPTR